MGAFHLMARQVSPEFPLPVLMERSGSSFSKFENLAKMDLRQNWSKLSD
jgi:hypothetical protein